MGSVYQSLLLYTEIRWLSRDKVLAKLFELLYEVSNFLLNQDMPELHQLLEDNTGWPNLHTWLAYMVDIFEHLNELNKICNVGMNIY